MFLSCSSVGVVPVNQPLTAYTTTDTPFFFCVRNSTGSSCCPVCLRCLILSCPGAQTVQPSGQAGDRGHPDARVDADQPAADEVCVILSYVAVYH